MDVPDTDATVGKSMAMLSNFGQDYGDEDILQAESFKSTVVSLLIFGIHFWLLILNGPNCPVSVGKILPRWMES